jgi:AmiR/NasT family two-component response regulator
MIKADSYNILIAEDEYLILMGLRSAVLRLGHRVIGEAQNGRQTVELALKLHPDLIIIDIKMPELDGLEAIKQINKNEIMIPSIVVTGYNEEDLIDKAINVGVFSYLIKPVNEIELGPAIEISMARFQEFKRLNKELIDTQNSLKARKYIEKAKGIIMDKYDLKEADAMNYLQKKSRNSNKKILDLAMEIIKADQVLNIGKK